MRVWLTLLGRGKAADWRVGMQVCFRGHGSVTDGVRDQRLQSPAVPRALLESLRLWSLWAQGGRRARRREEPETQARLSGSRLQGFFFFFLLVIFIPKVEHFFIYFLLFPLFSPTT